MADKRPKAVTVSLNWDLKPTGVQRSEAQQMNESDTQPRSTPQATAHQSAVGMKKYKDPFKRIAKDYGR